MLSILTGFANDRRSHGWKRREQHASRKMVMLVITMLAMITSATGRCGIAHYLSQTAFQVPMNRVAVKIAELNEQNREVSVRGLSFSPDGELIAARSAHEAINIWNWRSGRVQKTLQAPTGFASGSSINPIHYSPDGRMLAICEDKGAGNVVVRIWNTYDWSLKTDIVDNGPGVCRSIAFTPDGRLLIYAMFRVIQASEVIAYSTDSWRIVSRIQLGSWPLVGVEPYALAVSPDSRLLAISGTASTVVKESAQMRREKTVDIVDLSSGSIIKACHAEAGGAIAWAPDRSRLAVVGGEYMEMFDVSSCERTEGNDTARSAHMNVRVTPDGRYLIESDSNGRRTGLGVTIWDRTGKKLLQRISGDSASIAVSRDGKFLAIGGIGHTTIWQLK